MTEPTTRGSGSGLVYWRRDEALSDAKQSAIVWQSADPQWEWSWLEGQRASRRSAATTRRKRKAGRKSRPHPPPPPPPPPQATALAPAPIPVASAAAASVAAADDREVAALTSALSVLVPERAANDDDDESTAPRTPPAASQTSRAGAGGSAARWSKTPGGRPLSASAAIFRPAAAAPAAAAAAAWPLSEPVLEPFFPGPLTAYAHHALPPTAYDTPSLSVLRGQILTALRAIDHLQQQQQQVPPPPWSYLAYSAPFEYGPPPPPLQSPPLPPPPGFTWMNASPFPVVVTAASAAAGADLAQTEPQTPNTIADMRAGRDPFPPSPPHASPEPGQVDEAQQQPPRPIVAETPCAAPEPSSNGGALDAPAPLVVVG